MSPTTRATTRIVVLQAGLRNPSTTRMLAEEFVRETRAAFAAAGRDVDVRMIDIRDHAHGIADTFLAGFSNPDLQEALDATASADGLVVVTPTFSASYSGLFKSFIDIIEPESLVDKPVVLAATGGTERHSLMIDHALRPLFSYLGADALRTGVFAATQDFGSGEGSRVAKRVRRAAGELVARLAPAGQASPAAQSPSSAAPKGFGDDLVDFEDLMGSLGVGR
ncbi:CE1759 family FMN reductase [Aestuariimicrobium sp. Y1814]|uniref:CE1759 family FMN reductase n=1 Tax=Aestuariimicrobium sp. Y1814 TaxID=3418742 RepID=UPI003DA6E6D2